jgi:hypothetical protein
MTAATGNARWLYHTTPRARGQGQPARHALLQLVALHWFFEHLDGSPEAERTNVQEKPAEGIRNRNDVSNQSSIDWVKKAGENPSYLAGCSLDLSDGMHKTCSFDTTLFYIVIVYITQI